MARTKSSDRWLRRHFDDEFVKRAQKEGWRSRATFKLEEIDARDHLLRPGITVVDLGAAPGGWSQYIKKRLRDSGRVLALDILPMDPIQGVEFIQGDFAEQAVLDLALEQLRCAGTHKCRGKHDSMDGGDRAAPGAAAEDAGSGADRCVDLVLSDMAPNTSGVAAVDQAKSMNLSELAFEFADRTLKPGGTMLIKTFQGAGYSDLYKQMQARFEKLVARKPRASRSESREIYLLGKGFKGDREGAIVSGGT